MAEVIAIDAGTTGVRALVVDEAGQVVDLAYRELTQHFPRPGWVEHDGAEIWQAVRTTLAEVAARMAERGVRPTALGITNQRETTLAWDTGTGQPLHRAIVWQDRRTAADCEALIARGALPLVRAKTGLVLDSYFSATKMRWLLDHTAVGGLRDSPQLALGTVDSWVLWNLTGGPSGGTFLTDPSNASRTLLYDITERAWSDELCELFGVPRHALAEVRPSCGRFGTVAPGVLESGGLDGVPVSGILGDQQAALFGQACFTPGAAKATYGTGSFVLAHAGYTPPAVVEGLVTTVAWDLGGFGCATPFAYALEGSAFVSGAAIQWLRDGLGVIERADEMGPLAASVPDSGGVAVVPAFTGLGSPWWDPHARGTIVGLTRGSGRAELARAVVEAMAFQVRAILDRMVEASGQHISVLRVDGGAAAMDLLLQLQADQSRVEVARPATLESTALGAATVAGLAEGVWTLEDLPALWRLEHSFEPALDPVFADAFYEVWLRAVERARAWSDDEG